MFCLFRVKIYCGMPLPNVFLVKWNQFSDLATRSSSLCGMQKDDNSGMLHPPVACVILRHDQGYPAARRSSQLTITLLSFTDSSRASLRWWYVLSVPSYCCSLKRCRSRNAMDFQFKSSPSIILNSIICNITIPPLSHAIHVSFSSFCFTLIWFTGIILHASTIK